MTIKTVFAAAMGLLGLASVSSAPALADIATFKTAQVTGCANCSATDSTGLAVNATGHLLPTGWDVKAGTNGLYVGNRIGGTFTIPGKTFDLTGMKLFATSLLSSTTVPVTYTLYAFHLGSPVADQVQVTINSRVVRDLTLNDPRLTNIESLVVRQNYDIGYTYFIEMRFTPH